MVRAVVLLAADVPYEACEFAFCFGKLLARTADADRAVPAIVRIRFRYALVRAVVIVHSPKFHARTLRLVADRVGAVIDEPMPRFVVATHAH